MNILNDDRSSDLLYIYYTAYLFTYKKNLIKNSIFRWPSKRTSHFPTRSRGRSAVSWNKIRSVNHGRSSPSYEIAFPYARNTRRITISIATTTRRRRPNERVTSTNSRRISWRRWRSRERPRSRVVSEKRELVVAWRDKEPGGTKRWRRDIMARTKSY